MSLVKEAFLQGDGTLKPIHKSPVLKWMSKRKGGKGYGSLQAHLLRQKSKLKDTAHPLFRGNIR